MEVAVAAAAAAVPVCSLQISSKPDHSWDPDCNQIRLACNHKDKSAASFYWLRDGLVVVPEVHHPCCPADLARPQTEVVVAAAVAVDAKTGPGLVVKVPVVVVVVVAADLVC